MTELRSLTGLRGLAACWIVLFHLGGHMVGSGHIRMFVEHGYLAVDLFFALSGFVMALTASQPFANGFTVEAYFAFLLRRFARIWPLYAMTTIAAAIAISAGLFAKPACGFWPGLVANGLLIQGWGLCQSFVVPAWSVSTETAAYILLPALLAVTVFCKARRAVCVGLAAASMLCVLVILPAKITGVVRFHGPLDMSDARNYAPMTRCLLEFSFGLLAWRVAQCNLAKQAAESQALSAFLCAAIAVLLVFSGTDILVAILFPALIVSVSTDKPIVAKLLGCSLVRWLGEISYALYLVHYSGELYRDRFQRDFVTLRLPHAWSLAVAAVVVSSIGLAALAHYFVEKPARNAIRRRTFLLTHRGFGHIGSKA